MAGSVRPPIRCIDAPGTPPGGHYSHAAIVGDLIFLSGHLPVPASGRHDADADFAVQAERVLGNLSASLAAAGSSLGGLVKLTAYVTDIEDWPAFDRIYAKAMGDHRPARCVVPVSELHYDYRIEIEAVALVTGQGTSA